MLATLSTWRRSSHQLFLEYDVDGLAFTNTLWYPGCDLLVLEERFGTEVMENIYFHIAAFEMNKLCSLGLEEVDFGPFTSFVTDEFVAVWQDVLDGVWAQWRYENGRPAQAPTEVRRPDDAVRVGPRAAPDGPRPHLVFCGGGKDSLVASSLMSEIGEPHDLFVYTSSVYGPAQRQLDIIGGLVRHLSPGEVHTMSCYDDFLDSPVLRTRPGLGIRTLTAAETPASVVEALPVVLQHGYRSLVLGHERSADTGNLVWEATGEEVNHQWGKSWAAETLLAAYVRDHLVSNLEVFSILKPVHDVVIFGALRELPWDAVAATHSCNEVKPWCKRCAKCVYVWLSLLAYLDADRVRALFGEDLFELVELAPITDQLLGLGEHTPFECIGQAEESRVAWELCRAKGLTGPLMERYAGHDWAPEVPASLARFGSVDTSYRGVPKDLRVRLLKHLEGVAARTRAYVGSTMAPRP
jgi:hypothetical protein